MIVELFGNYKFDSAERAEERLTIERSFQSQLRNVQSSDGHRSHQRKEDRTFPVDPQQGAVYPPFLKDVAVAEPLCRSLVLETACDVVICGGVRRRLPFSKALSQVSPCGCIRYLTVNGDRSDNGRSTSFTLYAICCITIFTSVAASLPSGRYNISDGVGDFRARFPHHR
jgi:hypothetical protein